MNIVFMKKVDQIVYKTASVWDTNMFMLDQLYKYLGRASSRTGNFLSYDSLTETV